MPELLNFKNITAPLVKKYEITSYRIVKNNDENFIVLEMFGIQWRFIQLIYNFLVESNQK